MADIGEKISLPGCSTSQGLRPEDQSPANNNQKPFLSECLDWMKNSLLEEKKQRSLYLPKEAVRPAQRPNAGNFCPHSEEHERFQAKCLSWMIKPSEESVEEIIMEALSNPRSWCGSCPTEQCPGCEWHKNLRRKCMDLVLNGLVKQAEEMSIRAHEKNRNMFQFSSDVDFSQISRDIDISRSSSDVDSLPISSETDVLSLSSEENNRPISIDKDIWPSSSDKNIWPVFIDKDVCPAYNEDNVWPISSDKDGGPIFSDTDIEPIFTDTDVEPIFSDTDVGPIFSDKDVGPIFSDKDVGPIFSDKDVGPIFSDKDVEPISSENDIDIWQISYEIKKSLEIFFGDSDFTHMLVPESDAISTNKAEQILNDTKIPYEFIQKSEVLGASSNQSLSFELAKIDTKIEETGVVIKADTGDIPETKQKNTMERNQSSSIKSGISNDSSFTKPMISKDSSVNDERQITNVIEDKQFTETLDSIEKLCVIVNEGKISEDKNKLAIQIQSTSIKTNTQITSLYPAESYLFPTENSQSSKVSEDAGSVGEKDIE